MGKNEEIVHTGTNEDDLCQAAEGMDEMELLSELVAAFEQTAFETKKRVNALDRMAYTAQLLPPTLRVCFQTLVRSNKQDLKRQTSPDQEAENLEELITQATKASGDCIKDFGKFKGEFFAINEPIANKDISALTTALVQAQAEK